MFGGFNVSIHSITNSKIFLGLAKNVNKKTMYFQQKVGIAPETPAEMSCFQQVFDKKL